MSHLKARKAVSLRPSRPGHTLRSRLSLKLDSILTDAYRKDTSTLESLERS